MSGLNNLKLELTHSYVS